MFWLGGFVEWCFCAVASRLLGCRLDCHCIRRRLGQMKSRCRLASRSHHHRLPHRCRLEHVELGEGRARLNRRPHMTRPESAR